MRLFFQLIKTFFVWIVTTFLLIALVLMPRNTQWEKDGTTDVMWYKLDWSLFGEYITYFYRDVWENKSLGITRFGTTVEAEVWNYMSRSLIVIFLALIISFFLGVLKGVFDYRHTNKRTTIFGHGTTWFFQAIPDFFLLIAVSYLLLTLMSKGIIPNFPIYGFGKWHHVILPTIFVSIYPLFYIARITATALAEEDGKDYLRTARAKGVKEKFVIYRHALGNCWGYILSNFITVVLYILSSLPIIEFLTAYRGSAKRFLDALHIPTIFTPGTTFSIEYHVIIGFTFLYMVVILISIWISQIAKSQLDPLGREEEV